jgi:autotransporter-associated beta strand protein
MSFNGGTLQLGAGGVLATRSGGTHMAGAGTIDTNGFTTTYDGNITGSGALTKTGAGTLDLGGNNDAHAGALNINGGVLNASFNNAIGDTSAVTVAGGALFQVGTSETIGSLAGAGNTVLFFGGTLTTGGNNSSTSYTGIVSGSGSLTKTGTGTFSMAGAQTYSGLTTVSQGTLILNGSLADSLLIQAGATFGGNATITGDVTNLGIIASGNSPGSTIVLGNYAGGGVLDVEVLTNLGGAPVNGTSHDFLSIGGDVSGNTLINILPSGTPVPTAGNGFELVRVAGAVTSTQFALSGPVVHGGYQYLLDYLPDYSGTLDGFFLRALTRDDLFGHAALASVGQTLNRQCSAGEEEGSGHSERAEGSGVWVGFNLGDFEAGAASGTPFDMDFTCVKAGVDTMVADWLRIGIGGMFGSSDTLITAPATLADLDGDHSAIEAYARINDGGLFFADIAVGYGQADWSYSGLVSTDAESSGLLFRALAGLGVAVGDYLHVELTAQLRHDGMECDGDCLAPGASEDLADWDAEAGLRIAGLLDDGRVRPYGAVTFTESLGDGNSISLGGATSVSNTADGLIGWHLGLDGNVSESITAFLEANGADDSEDVKARGVAGGVKLFW